MAVAWNKYGSAHSEQIKVFVKVRVMRTRDWRSGVKPIDSATPSTVG
ncbi:MAG TPA: hypothetical protein V6C91_19775 [Coleofasciculaceae cyanobacterium]